LHQIENGTVSGNSVNGIREPITGLDSGGS
jgi:hypothetical protein